MQIYLKYILHTVDYQIAIKSKAMSMQNKNVYRIKLMSKLS